MKRIFLILTVFAMVLGLTVSAQAELYDRGGGMIYDDGLDITWLADANYAMTSGYDTDGLMNWNDSVAWADGLSFGGYDDWRLAPSDTCFDYNCTGSEMGDLFYNELGGIAGSSISSVNNGSDGFDLFSNIQSYSYWSGTEYAPNPDNAWDFDFNDGYQDAGGKGNNFYAWAVRSGDVSAAPVPEPGTALLMGFGLAGLALYRRKTGTIASKFLKKQSVT